MKNLICMLCKEVISSKYDDDRAIESLLKKLVMHVSNLHKEEYKAYQSDLSEVIAVIPGHLLIEYFVDLDKTKEQNPDVTDKMDKVRETVISSIVGEVVEIDSSLTSQVNST